MDSSGQIPPFHPDSSPQPEDSGNPKKEPFLPEAKRYIPENPAMSKQDTTSLPDYDISLDERPPAGAAAQLPDSCPVWFKDHEDLFQELIQYQQYFTEPANQAAFLNGDGPYYNPLIIARLRLQAINETESLTDEQKLDIEQWQDIALQNCPLPWRTLPLKLNHLNKEWGPSPQAAHFIKSDAENRVAQIDAGDFIPDWMQQKVLGIPIGEATTQYWNLRNNHAQPGRTFLTMDRLKAKDPALYNWLALFKDARVWEEAGLSDRQVAVVNYRLSFADEEIAKHLSNKRCKTKSHLYTWKKIPAEPELYERVKIQLKEQDIPKRLEKKRASSSRSKTSSETSSDKSVSPPARKKKRHSQDSLKSQKSQKPIPDDTSGSSSELDNGAFLMIHAKKHPYSEEIKYAGEPNVHRRLKIYEKPHMYDFQTASEEQIPEWSPSSSRPSSVTSDRQHAEVVFDQIEVPQKLLPLLGVSNASSSCMIPVEQVISELESVSSHLYQSQNLPEAEKLLDDLKQLQKTLLSHFDSIYQQHTDSMYTPARENLKKAKSSNEDPMDMELLISEEQHAIFEKILTAQDELCQLKFQAEYCLKRLRENTWVRDEPWHTAELLRSTMAKTRGCLLGGTGLPLKVALPEETQLSVPVKLFFRLRHLETIRHDSQSDQVKLSSAELCKVIIKNINLISGRHSNNIGVWEVEPAKEECDHLLVVFDYFIESLKPKRSENPEAFENYQTMEALRNNFQNFRNALKETNHTEMHAILKKHMKSISHVTARLSTESTE